VTVQRAPASAGGRAERFTHKLELFAPDGLASDARTRTRRGLEISGNSSAGGPIPVYGGRLHMPRTFIPPSVANANLERIRPPAGDRMPSRGVMHLYVNDEKMKEIKGLEQFDGFETARVVTMVRDPAYPGSRPIQETVGGDYQRPQRSLHSDSPVTTRYVGKTPDGWDHHIVEFPVDAEAARSRGLLAQIDIRVGQNTYRTTLPDTWTGNDRIFPAE
jgi:hypothetical protein